MKTALVALALLSSASSVVTAAPRRPTVKAVCSGTAIPFPIPDDAAEITDSEFEALAASLWDEFCEDADKAAPRSYVRRVCACRHVIPVL